MRTCVAVSLIASLLTVAVAPSRADGLLHKLPPDGAWAKFDLEWLGPAPVGDPAILTVLQTGTLTVSSVGQTEIDGEQHRWIEIRNASTRNDREFVTVQKMLIPEKYLLSGLNPLGHVVRAWALHPAVNGGEPQKITDFRGEQARPIRALTDMFFGPPAEIRVLDEEIIDTPKLGSRRCPGVAAQYVLARGNLESIFDYETRLHDKAPFGVVTFRSESVHKEGGEVKIPKHVTLLRLADFGTDAESALPDQK